MSFLPFVTIVIPAYNAETTLPACLKSLCELTYPQTQTEIIVVNNNSQDNTRAVIQTFAPRVRCLDEKKRGPAAARNCGIAHAQGEIIAFTDADCIVEPDWLTRLIVPLRDETVGAVGGAILSARSKNPIELFGEQIHSQENAICLYKPGYVATPNWASPKNLLLQLGMFDEQFQGGEDTDLAWRILQAGKRLAYQPSARVYHRNATTLRGLFHEGFQHGYHSVFVNRRHERFLRAFGYSRLHRYGYVRLVASLREHVVTHSTFALCDFTFNSGKKVGKLFGSLRTGYLEL